MADFAAALPVGAPSPAASFDAGDLGCGEIVVELKFRLAELPPGAHLLVHGTDAGLPEDLPAWCRMTRHRLVHHAHPWYLIQGRAS